MDKNADPDPKDPEASEKAGEEKSKKAAAALIAQRRLLDLFGKLEWDPTFDYKRERSRE